MPHALLDNAFKRIVVRYTTPDKSYSINSKVRLFEPPRDSASWLEVAPAITDSKVFCGMPIR